MAKAFTLPNQDVCAEILLILIACFAPWAYGSVDASSEFVLYAGVFAAAGLRAIADLPKVVRRVLVYLGDRRLRTDDGIEVWPLKVFLQALDAGTLWP